LFEGRILLRKGPMKRWRGGVGGKKTFAGSATKERGVEASTVLGYQKYSYGLLVDRFRLKRRLCQVLMGICFLGCRDKRTRGEEKSGKKEAAAHDGE